MKHALFRLCQLQLESIMNETGRDIDSATASANDCLEGLNNIRHNGGPDDVSLCKLQKGMSNIMVRLQFHDELSQRVAHLTEILALMDESVRLEGDGDDAIVERILSIFSIRSEFEQLEKVFPGLIDNEETESVELF